MSRLGGAIGNVFPKSFRCNKHQALYFVLLSTYNCICNPACTARPPVFQYWEWDGSHWEALSSLITTVCGICTVFSSVYYCGKFGAVAARHWVGFCTSSPEWGCSYRSHSMASHHKRCAKQPVILQSSMFKQLPRQGSIDLLLLTIISKVGLWTRVFGSLQSFSVQSACRELEKVSWNHKYGGQSVFSATTQAHGHLHGCPDTTMQAHEDWIFIFCCMIFMLANNR